MNLYELYAFQLLHFFVEQHHYQMMTIQGQRQDVWLLNREQKQFPLICITNGTNEEIGAKQEYFTGIATIMLGEYATKCQLLICNTNPQCSDFTNTHVIHLAMKPNGLENELVKSCFPGMEHVVHTSDNPSKEVAQLRIALEVAQRRRNRSLNKGLRMKRFPKLTGVIMLVCILIAILAFMSALYLESDVLSIILWGGYYKMNVVSMHEYWRLLTAGFLHIDLIHLFANMMALYAIGAACEKVYSKGRYIAILLVSIVVGNLFVFIGNGNVLGLGISGGIFGLMGAYFASLWESGMNRHPMVRITIWRLLIVNFLISLLPGISMLAHIGGFVSGVFMGIMFSKSARWANLRIHVGISFALLLGMSVFLSMRALEVYPLQKTLDRTLLQTVRALGFSAYGDRMETAYLRYYSPEDLGLEIDIERIEAPIENDVNEQK